MTPDPSSPSVALPAPAGVIAPAARAKPDMRLLGFLALGHMVIDINQGSFPVILPFLKDALNLSYGATGLIVLAANITSSLIQPLFGYLADKTARRWLLPISVLLSAVGPGFLRLAPAHPPGGGVTARPPVSRSSRPAAISASRWVRRCSRCCSPPTACPAASACSSPG